MTIGCYPPMRHTEWISSWSIKQFISDLEILLLIFLHKGIIVYLLFTSSQQTSTIHHQSPYLLCTHDMHSLSVIMDVVGTSHFRAFYYKDGCFHIFKECEGFTSSSSFDKYRMNTVETGFHCELTSKGRDELGT